MNPLNHSGEKYGITLQTLSNHTKVFLPSLLWQAHTIRQDITNFISPKKDKDTSKRRHRQTEVCAKPMGFGGVDGLFKTICPMKAKPNRKEAAEMAAPQRKEGNVTEKSFQLCPIISPSPTPPFACKTLPRHPMSHPRAFYT